jgi:hypothetical protein
MAGWRRPGLPDSTEHHLSEVTIVPVRTRAELTRFIRLPARLFAADPHFVPQLEMERRDALSPGRNPYFEHAEAQYFLAVRNGRDVGRITAQIDRLVKDAALGHFGMIAAEDDPAIFAALFRAAEDWLRQRGRTRVLGPFNLSINEETGLLVKGFHAPPMVFMSHDPPYAGARVEEQGYTKAKDLIAYLYPSRNELPAAARRLLDRRTPADLRVRRIDMKNYMAEFDLVIDMFNDAWSENWGFVPFTPAELKHMAKGLKPLINPAMTAIVELRGQPVAFGITLPNLNEVIRDFNGRLFPFNFLKLLWRIRRGTRTARVPLMGIRRSFSGGLVGGLLPFLIIDSMREGSKSTPLEETELSWILEDNLPMRRIIESLGSDPYKTYRVYEKQL